MVIQGPDRHLPRDVAWKVAARRDTRLRVRLATEARALASLEHPNIVPIYDQETGPDGELRVALRIIHGETLEQLIRRTRELSARLDVVRDLLKAVEAVAWAHHRGWIHRDLKPANIMLGEFGEVQVIDWGLARRMDEPTDPDLEPPGAPLGTFTTMSPEQARGELASFTSDVWGLGATLFELVSGRSLYDGTPSSALERLRVGDREAVLDVQRDTPPALAAIIERALAFDPEARYPNARALAQDLSAFVDGRRVSAHVYGTGERLAAFIRRWRVAVGVGLAALFATLVVGAFMLVRVEAERTRAVDAHDQALRALEDRDREAMRAGSGEARRALDADERLEAEQAAAKVLSIGEDPIARGVIASFARSPRNQLVWDVPTGECLDADVDPTGRVVVCGRRDSLSVFEDGRERWTRPLVHRSAALTDEGAGVLVQYFEGPIEILDARDGSVLIRSEEPTHLGLVRPGPGARYATIEDRIRLVLASRVGVSVWLPCATSFIQASAFGPTQHAALCSDGTLVVVDTSSGEREVVTPLASVLREYVSMAFAGTGRVIVGTTRGVLHVVDLLDGRVVETRAVDPPRMIRRVEVDDAGERGVAELDGVGPMLFDARSLARFGSLPRTSRAVRWLGAGSAAGADLVAYGRGVAGWSVPAGPVYRVSGFGSISGAHVGVESIGVAHGQAVSVLDGDGGRVLWHRDWGDGVTKQAIFGGHELLVATARAPREGRDISTLDEMVTVTTMFPARRLYELPTGVVVRSLTEPGLELWWGRGDTLRLSDAHHNDMTVFRGWIAGLESRPSRFTWYEADRTPVALGACVEPAALALALGPGGSRGVTVFTAQARQVVAWDLEDCRPEAVFPADHGELRRVAVTPDGAWVAAGTLGGEVFVWRRDGTLVAVAPLHSESVSSLTADPLGRWFVSTSWDGQLRFIDVATLTRPPDELAQEILMALAPGGRMPAPRPATEPK